MLTNFTTLHFLNKQLQSKSLLLSKLQFKYQIVIQNIADLQAFFKSNKSSRTPLESFEGNYIMIYIE